jgi:hypothetical protein
VKEKAMKHRIDTIVLLYITASECNEGVVVLTTYQRISCPAGQNTDKYQQMHYYNARKSSITQD